MELYCSRKFGAVLDVVHKVAIYANVRVVWIKQDSRVLRSRTMMCNADLKCLMALFKLLQKIHHSLGKNTSFYIYYEL